MARQHDVPRFAGQGGVGDVSDRTLKNRGRIALNHDGLEPEPRHQNLADRTTFDHG